LNAAADDWIERRNTKSQIGNEIWDFFLHRLIRQYNLSSTVSAQSFYASYLVEQCHVLRLMHCARACAVAFLQ
jgi:hypothetical protein